jgi:hypothetical protein
MTKSGRERCLACDYDLRGLPSRHRCPECGLAYDDRTRVWRPGASLSIIPGILAFGVVLPFVLIKVTSSTPHATWGRIVSLLWFVAVLLAGLWIRFIHRRRYVVATMPDGLLVRVGKVCLIPWNDLAVGNLTNSEIRIKQISSNSTIDLTSFFSNTLQTRSFVDHVTAARARYWRVREETARREHERQEPQP